MWGRLPTGSESPSGAVGGRRYPEPVGPGSGDAFRCIPDTARRQPGKVSSTRTSVDRPSACAAEPTRPVKVDASHPRTSNTPNALHRISTNTKAMKTPPCPLDAPSPYSDTPRCPRRNQRYEHALATRSGSLVLVALSLAGLPSQRKPFKPSKPAMHSRRTPGRTTTCRTLIPYPPDTPPAAPMPPDTPVRTSGTRTSVDARAPLSLPDMSSHAQTPDPRPSGGSQRGAAATRVIPAPPPLNRTNRGSNS